jgi:uncharacterized protein YndB with AHSA1/START domain
MESLRVSAVIPADPSIVYRAWISAEEHSAMTGAPATSDARTGGRHSAWDGYITGSYLDLTPNRRILQTWRTTEFPERSEPSRLEIRLSKVREGTRVMLLQSGIPDGQTEMYTEGWIENYFEPMKVYFLARRRAGTKKKSKQRASAKSKAAKKPARKSPSATKKRPAKAAKKPAAKKPKR